jgi:hypothetical protein
MSNVSISKTKGEAYVFNWSMPAPDGGSDTGGTVLHSVPMAEEGNQEHVQEGSEPVQSQDAYSNYASPFESTRRLEVPSLRLLGIIAWSAVAGSGMMAVAMKFGSAAGMQVAEIGGLWLAVGAAIWLVPGKLLK